MSETKHVQVKKSTNKAERFDAIVKESRYYFGLWIKQHALSVMLANGTRDHGNRINYRNDASRFASLAHEHYQVLRLAGIELECPCAYCLNARDVAQAGARERIL